jgi:hypothetical protein
MFFSGGNLPARSSGERLYKVNPSSLDDPVAKTTLWTPLAVGGSNFQTQALCIINPHRMEFRATWQVDLSALMFIFFGLMAIIWFSPISFDDMSFQSGHILPSIIGVVLLWIGCFLMRIFKPVIFDRDEGYFWKGKKPDQPQEIWDDKIPFVRIESIYALQIISQIEVSPKGGSSYNSYQLNIVSKDGKRVNVIDHGDLTRICDDAAALAEFLGKPLWDVGGN